MPLVKSRSDAAFKTNVSEMIQAGHPRDQSLAAAYRIKRGRATGGLTPTPWQTRYAARAMTHSGPIMSAVPGRTDNHPMHVGPGGYVLPADHVSSLGQGNTSAGMAVLNHMFGPSGPLGIGRTPPTHHGPGAPRPPRMMTPRPPKMPTLGRSEGGEVPGEPVPIMAAGGEYVVSPEIVAHLGDGDMKRGQDLLDDWVLANRRKHISTLRGLPPPAKS